MKTKTIKFKNFICLAFVLLLFFLAGFSLFVPTNIAHAAAFVNEVVTNDGITMQMTVSNRRNVTLDRVEEIVVDTVGQETTYLCFNWRDLESLNFRFSGTISSSSQFTSYRFDVTHVRAENLNQAIGTGTTETLYEADIVGNNFPTSEFYYYVDSDSGASSSNSSSGHDFGLYKFDLIYTHSENGETVDVSIGSINVAVIPDDITQIEIPAGVSILYTVSSSNALMNIYQLSVSTDVFDYVNPDYLQWSAFGTGVGNMNYVLNQQMKEENPSYSSYEVLYDSYETPVGTSFVFDSNDVEGNWTVVLSIKNPDGTEKATFQVTDLSTYRTERQSYLWLILLIILIVLFVVFLTIIIIMIVRKKREKVW